MVTRNLILLVGMTTGWTFVCAARAEANEPFPQQLSDEIRPLVAKYCLACHSQKGPGWADPGATAKSRCADHVAGVEESLGSAAYPPDAAARESATQPPGTAAAGGLSRKGLCPGEMGRTARPRTAAATPAQCPRVHEYAPGFGGDQRQAGRGKTSFAPLKDGRISLYRMLPPPEHPTDFVARMLPQDTNDGGFDTIADNLSFPPFLLEKYLRVTKVSAG